MYKIFDLCLDQLVLFFSAHLYHSLISRSNFNPTFSLEPSLTTQPHYNNYNYFLISPSRNSPLCGLLCNGRNANASTQTLVFLFSHLTGTSLYINYSLSPVSLISCSLLAPSHLPSLNFSRVSNYKWSRKCGTVKVLVPPRSSAETGTRRKKAIAVNSGTCSLPSPALSLKHQKNRGCLVVAAGAG